MRHLVSEGYVESELPGAEYSDVNSVDELIVFAACSLQEEATPGCRYRLCRLARRDLKFGEREQTARPTFTFYIRVRHAYGSLCIRTEAQLLTDESVGLGLRRLPAVARYFR